MADEVHKAYLETYKYHLSVGTYENGACLVKHIVPFKDGDSCSYRWQGVKKAETDGKAAYNAHQTTRYHIPGRGAGVFDPSNVSAVQNSAGMAGGKVLRNIMVDVTRKAVTKKELKSLVEVNNFTVGSVPYGNQVHHVLNASSLRKGIDTLAEHWYPIRWVIVNGLLSEKYNLNYKDNNLILPTKNYHSWQTGLPTHYGSHPAYSAKILTAVERALTPYEKIADQMKNNEQHDKLEPAKVKKDLEDISKTMYGNILSQAAANRAARKGMKINEMPLSAYAGI